MGFSRPEIVKELSRKYGCCERTVYRDYEIRSSWQRYDDEKTVLKALNRYEYIYCTASRKMLTASQESVQVAWARVMLEATNQMVERFTLPQLLRDVKDLKERAEKGVFL